MPNLPLEGIRVADFSWFGAGPICAQTLAEFGAEVVRVESETHLDGLRLVQPFAMEDGKYKTGYNVSGYFNNFNANKLSLTVNLNSERGHEVAMRLVEKSDVFLSNMTPRVVERWRLTYDELVKVNPTIIAAYQPMQGYDGPHRDFLGFGAVLGPVTGFNYLTGFPHRPPIGVGTNYPDYCINPGHTVVAILAALRYRRRTGKGQRIELAQLESTVSCLGTALMDYAVNGRVQERSGNRIPHASPHNAFRCQDLAGGIDRWCVIAVYNDAQWDALVQAMGSPGWAREERFQTLLGRKANEDELEERLTEWTRPQTAEAVTEALQSRSVPAGVVQNAQDMLERDPHMKARGYYRYLEHPETGLSAYDGPPAKLSKTPGGPTRPAPLLGEHTAEVCLGILGYNEDELADLYAEGALT